MKEALASLFRRAFKQLALSSNESYRLRLSQNSCFKPLYESNNDQLLLQSNLLIVFYQQKVNKNGVFQQITGNTNKIHQGNFLKVAVLNRSTKGAMTGFFRRSHFP